MEFKLPKKYDDGFNKAGDDVIAEEDNNMSQVTTSSATQKSSPVKKFGKIHKKTLEPSPLTLSRVENEIDNKTNSVKTHKNSSSTTQNAAKQAIRGKKKILWFFWQKLYYFVSFFVNNFEVFLFRDYAFCTDLHTIPILS